MDATSEAPFLEARHGVEKIKVAHAFAAYKAIT
jgi:hypothetical protein